MSTIPISTHAGPLASDGGNSATRPKASPFCNQCGGTSHQNKDDRPEGLVSCADCYLSDHPSCLGLETALVQAYDWQCRDCKRCMVCETDKRLDENEEDLDKYMVLCDACDRGCHTFCATPKLKKVPKGRWQCSICKPSGR